MNTGIKIEVCLDSAESAVAAQRGGADRVELCDNLFEGGTTPSLGMIRVTRRSVTLGLHAIIRPRGGDFCYTATEFAVMKEDVAAAKAEGCDGVVIGILTPEGRVDLERCRELIELARPMSVTFHRAFDVTVDAFQALEDIIGLGVDRILSSGQESSVWEGAELLRRLVERAGERIIVMPGAGITERNIDRVAAAIGAAEYHVLLDSAVPSGMTYRPDHVFMGGLLRPPEFTGHGTDAAKVGRIRQALSRS